MTDLLRTKIGRGPAPPMKTGVLEKAPAVEVLPLLTGQFLYALL